jgi:hypothetical protein
MLENVVKTQKNDSHPHLHLILVRFRELATLGKLFDSIGVQREDHVADSALTIFSVSSRHFQNACLLQL